MNQNAMLARIKWGVILLAFIALDTLPGSILGFILAYVLIFRPHWFKRAVDDIYQGVNNPKPK